MKTLFAMAALGGVLLGAMPAAAVVVTTGSGTIANTDASQTNRVLRNGVASTWAAPKAFPGTIGGTFFFDEVDVSFAPNAAQDVYYQISFTNLDAGSPHAVAYLNSFDPGNIATNYLGDAGSTPGAGGTGIFQVKVGAGDALVLDFGGVNSQFGRYDYTVEAFSDADFGQSFGVPEPATWALMLTGFGLAGVSLRRRRTAVAA